MVQYKVQKKKIYFSKRPIIDADLKNEDLIVLIQDKGQLVVELNTIPLLTVPTTSYLIRFTKQYFCILIADTVNFYTLNGEFISSTFVGKHVHQLFPYNDGVICIYGDQGVFSDDLGANILNFAQPNSPLQSLEELAHEYSFSFDTLFTRSKPIAAISHTDNAILLFDEQLKEISKLPAPFDLSNTFAFSLTFDSAFFIEEQQIIIWRYKEDDDALQRIPNTFQSVPQTVNFRGTTNFIEVTSNEIISYVFAK